MTDILVHFESSPNFVCNVAYDYHDFGRFVAHVWEHLVLNTTVDHDASLKDKVVEMGGSIAAETSLSLTNFFVKLPSANGDHLFLKTLCSAIRYPTINDDALSQVYREVVIEELLRKDNNMIVSLEKLRAKLYKDYHESILESAELADGIKSFSRKMLREPVFICLAAASAPDYLYDYSECDPADSEISPTRDNIVNNDYIVCERISCMKQHTNLEYLAIILLPSKVKNIVLPFLNFVVFGMMSHFIRQLTDSGYIYSYRSGVNYHKPVGIEFVTAVLPENAEKVLKMWGDFKENTEKLLSREHTEIALDKFFEILSLEWLHTEKKVKWIAESFTLYRAIVDPDIFKKVVVESNTLETLPELIKKSPSYASLVGPLENSLEL